MRAADLAEAHLAVGPDTPVAQALAVMVSGGWPGLVVTTGTGRPYTVLAGSTLLRLMLPPYVRDDPGLARALDAEAADDVCRRLVSRTVRDLVPAPRPREDQPLVEADATSLEIAGVLARTRSPLAGVLRVGVVVGVVTATRLLSHLMPPGSPC